MQACRYALEVVAKHPIYLLVYVGFLSLMGLFITSGVYPPATSAGYESAEVPFAVIDRDQSDLSRSVAAFLEERGTSVEVADEARACARQWATRRGRRRKASRLRSACSCCSRRPSSLRRSWWAGCARPATTPAAMQRPLCRGSAVGAVPGSRRTLRRGRCAARYVGCAIVLALCFSFAPAGNLWHNTDSRI